MHIINFNVEKPITRRDGKIKHIQSAIKEIISKSNDKASLISLETTVLVDDDMNNISVAKLHKIRACQCDPTRPDKMIESLMTLEDYCE